MSVSEYEAIGQLEGAVREEAQRVITEADPSSEDLEALHAAFVPTMVRINAEGAYARRRALFDDLLVHRNGRLKDAEALSANPRFTVPEASVERVYLEACSTAQRARETAEKEEQEQRIRDAERIAEEQKKAAEAQKKIAHRTRIGLVAILLVAALAAVAAWFAYNGEQKARERLRAAQITESRFLADRPRQEADQGHAGLGILLALKALPDNTGDDGARPYVVEAEVALYHALQQPYDQSVLKSEGVVLATALSPDGTRAATLGSDGEHIITSDFGAARLWTVSRAIQMATLRRDKEQCRAVTFSPDAKHAVTACSDGVHLWDVHGGKPIASWPVHTGRVLSLAFNRDGSRIVTGSMDLTAHLSDTTLHKSTVVLAGHQERVWDAVFNADASRIGTTSGDATIRLWGWCDRKRARRSRHLPLV